MDERVYYTRPEDYAMCSVSYQPIIRREYRPTSTAGLHSGEYFIEQGERELRRMNVTLYRCAIGAVGLVGLIYCIVKFL